MSQTRSSGDGGQRESDEAAATMKVGVERKLDSVPARRHFRVLLAIASLQSWQNLVREEISEGDKLQNHILQYMY